MMLAGEILRFALAGLALGALAQQATSPALPAQEPVTSIRVDVELVRVACSATEHGVPVKGLQQSDFSVRENSVAQEIKYFWQESDLPLSLGLIVDVSGSQATLIHKHKQTLTDFFRQVLRPEDQAMIVTVGPQVRLLTDFTHSQEELANGIERVRVGGRAGAMLGEPCPNREKKVGPRRHQRTVMVAGCGGTALWNAIYYASQLKMRPVSGRKALIVLSDGWDTGSVHGLEDAIEAAQSAETAVYTIKFVSPLIAVLAPPVAFKHPMNKLSEETGGVAYGMMHGDLRDVFQQIENELRNQYILAYYPSDRTHDGTFRKLEVKANRKGVQVRTRTGYWARGK